MSEKSSHHHRNHRRPRVEHNGIHVEVEPGKRRISFPLPNKYLSFLEGITVLDTQMTGKDLRMSDELDRSQVSYLSFRSLDPELPVGIITGIVDPGLITPEFHPPSYDDWTKVNVNILETVLSDYTRLSEYDSKRTGVATDVADLLTDTVKVYAQQRLIDPNIGGQLMAARFKLETQIHPDAPPDVIS